MTFALARRMAVAAAAACGLAVATAAPQPPEVFHYRGLCDASAAVALDQDRFVVADDEHDVLRIYRRGRPNPVGELDLSAFLGSGKGRGRERDRGRESDLEGAAAVGTRTYWISSHGRQASGRERRQRHRFFATETLAAGRGEPRELAPVGRPYTGLLDDLAGAPGLEELAQAAGRAPEAEGGLNIEGLAAMPDGRLLIGFRNPVPGGRALLVPLLDPDSVIERGERARFGPPIRLDLDGRGIRSIERVGSEYLIVAGAPDDGERFALYRWSGEPGQEAAPMTRVELAGLRPEALFAIPGTGQVQLLSDDGGRRVAGVRCRARPPAQRSFGSLILRP